MCWLWIELVSSFSHTFSRRMRICYLLILCRASPAAKMEPFLLCDATIVFPPMQLNCFDGERSQRLKVNRSNHGMALIFPEYASLLLVYSTVNIVSEKKCHPSHYFSALFLAPVMGQHPLPIFQHFNTRIRSITCAMTHVSIRVYSLIRHPCTESLLPTPWDYHLGHFGLGQYGFEPHNSTVVSFRLQQVRGWLRQSSLSCLLFGCG